MTPKPEDDDIKMIAHLFESYFFESKIGQTPQTISYVQDVLDWHQQQLEQAVREAQLAMANNLIDQERKLYKIFDDDKQICVGIKEMADEVREYFDGGVYVQSTKEDKSNE